MACEVCLLIFLRQEGRNFTKISFSFVNFLSLTSKINACLVYIFCCCYFFVTLNFSSSCIRVEIINVFVTLRVSSDLIFFSLLLSLSTLIHFTFLTLKSPPVLCVATAATAIGIFFWTKFNLSHTLSDQVCTSCYLESLMRLKKLQVKVERKKIRKNTSPNAVNHVPRRGVFCF